MKPKSDNVHNVYKKPLRFEIPRTMNIPNNTISIYHIRSTYPNLDYEIKTATTLKACFYIHYLIQNNRELLEDEMLIVRFNVAHTNTIRTVGRTIEQTIKQISGFQKAPKYTVIHKGLNIFVFRKRGRPQEDRVYLSNFIKIFAQMFDI